MRKDYNYFECFQKMAGFAGEAAKMLNAILNDFDAESTEIQLAQIHAVEHAADVEQHTMMKRLAREFITPIEREDIIEFAQEIDNVTDAIEDVLRKIYMYNISSIRPEALEFSSVIVQCCEGIQKITAEFHNFKRSETVMESIIEVNRLEEVGDKLYTDFVRRLYIEEKDPIEILRWSETFACLEDCCDACEHVANVIETIIMKNS